MANRLGLHVDRGRLAAGNAAFANRVSFFANQTAWLARLPGFPLLWISSAAAAVLATVTGAFGTDALPFAPRAFFWALLLGWNLAKWQTWFAFTVRRSTDWTRAAMAGGILLNLTLPVETVLCMRAVGVPAATDFERIWLYALVISVALFAVIWTAKRRVASAPREAASAPPVPAPAADGLLARAGVASDALVAIHAEDHYCRILRRDGSSALVHYRFSDALSEVAGLDGAQVHRGSWVATSALRGASRKHRRWCLLLADGSWVPVSSSRLAEVRRRGWLRISSTT